jgi:hypothetical protein
MKSTCFALAAALALAASSATAVAAPDRSGSVDASHSSFSWDSKLGTGFTTVNTQHDGKVPCGTAVVHDCDDTLLHVTGCGTLQVTNTGNTPNAVDTDLYSYYSNANGDKVDAGPTSSASTPTPNESLAIDMAEPDSYILLEIDYTDNVGGTVHGVATFTPAGLDIDPSTCQPVDGGGV